MKRCLSTYRFGIGIVVVFVISRLLYNAAGVYYDASMYDWAWQLLEVDLLKHKLLESVWYMHSQPPLFNLFCGFVLKISGVYYPQVFHFTFLCFGILSACMMWDIMKLLGIHKIISFFLTLVYVCSPTTILYENWLFYSYLEPFLLLLIIWSSVRYFKYTDKKKYLWITLFSVSATCLTRSMFHIGFLVIFIGIIVFISKERKQILAISIIPFFLTFFWYLKNLVLFGTFSASTWFGMNFARMSYDENTPLGKIGLWQDPDIYREIIPFPDSPYPVDALTQKQKKSGSYNFNYYGYIAVSEQFKKEAFEHLKKHPYKYGDKVYYAMSIFFEPADQIRNNFLEKNRQKIPSINRIYNYGYESPTGFINQNLVRINRWIYIIILLGSFGVIFYRRRDKIIPKIVLLICFISLYIFAVGTMFEVIENNRFRFPTISMFTILAGLVIHHIYIVFKHFLLKNKKRLSA